jgi:hypothetical protein
MLDLVLSNRGQVGWDAPPCRRGASLLSRPASQCQHLELKNTAQTTAGYGLCAALSEFRLLKKLSEKSFNGKLGKDSNSLILTAKNPFGVKK